MDALRRHNLLLWDFGSILAKNCSNCSSTTMNEYRNKISTVLYTSTLNYEMCVAHKTLIKCETIHLCAASLAGSTSKWQWFHRWSSAYTHALIAKQSWCHRRESAECHGQPKGVFGLQGFHVHSEAMESKCDLGGSSGSGHVLKELYTTKSCVFLGFPKSFAPLDPWFHQAFVRSNWIWNRRWSFS